MSVSTLALREEIHSVLSRDLNLQVETVESDLIASGVIDSVALVELIPELEARYGVEILLDEVDLEVFRSVTTIAMFISQLRPQASPAAWEDSDPS